MSKTFMKTFKYSVFGIFLAFGVLFSSAKVEAAVQFANTSACWPDVVQAMPGNSYQQNQTNCSDWLGNPAINPGGTLWVGVYIRNTGSTAANNATVSLTKNETSTNNFSFYGTLSGGGSSISGNATAQVSGSTDQDLTLQSVKLYINQDGMGNMLLLSTLTGSQAQAILNGGVQIGTIPGIYSGNCYNGGTNPWCTQGMVVATFVASNNQTPPPPPPQNTCDISYFNAGDTSLNENQSTTLSWGSTGAYGATITGPNGFYQNVSSNGSLSVSPNTSGNFTLTLNCQSNTIQGDTSDSIYISVDQEEEEEDESCSVEDFYASPSTIQPGGYAVLHWDTDNANSVYIQGSGFYQNVGSNGSLSVHPYGTTTYSIHVSCNGDSDSDTTTVHVNAILPPPPPMPIQYVCSNGIDDDFDGVVDMNDPGCLNMYDSSEYNQANFFVTTTVATNISSNSATLNGLVTSASGTTSGYFQWGPSYDLGYSTASQYIGSNGTIPFASGITGLKPDTFYYFRAVAVSNGVTKYGQIIPFKTTVGQVLGTNTTTVIRNVVSGGGNGNLLDLKVIMREELACTERAHDFEVTYKNISGVTVRDVVIRVAFPKYVVYRSASNGVYTPSDNTLTVQIPELEKGEEGVITISADTLPRAYREEILVTTATASYRNTSNVLQEDAIAYGVVETNRCPDNNLLGFAFGAGFWPNSVFGWLLLILLLLLLIYIARRIYKDRPVATVRTQSKAETYTPPVQHTAPHSMQNNFHNHDNH